jgi:hypothetical protein
VSVLIVDFDLAWFEEGDQDADAYLTGEIVCYLARCFSSVGAIVGVNQFGSNPFNLTLQDPLDSFADINIGDQQLVNPGLWNGTSEGFRPWYWPNLSQLSDLLTSRADAVEERLDTDAVEFLSLPVDPGATLPRAVLADLEPRGGEGTNLRDIGLSSQLGLRGGDLPADDKALSRILAARLGKWIDQRLLPTQDPLIDGPHLVQRNSALLGDRANDENAWQSVCVVDSTAADAFIGELNQRRWAQEVWSTRPVWRIDLVMRDEELPGVRNPWEIPDLGMVFCEDVSTFIPRDRARSFIVELPTAAPTRYIIDPAHEANQRDFGDLTDVQYQPSYLLSL